MIFFCFLFLPNFLGKMSIENRHIDIQSFCEKKCASHLDLFIAVGNQISQNENGVIYEKSCIKRTLFFYELD